MISYTCFLAIAVLLLPLLIDAHPLSSLENILETTTHQRRKYKYSGMTFTNERYCPNISMSSAVGNQSLAHLATTGANFVSVVVTQYQDNVTSTDIYPVYGEPILCNATPGGYCVTATDEEVEQTIYNVQTVHNMGVMLKLQIDLIHSPIGVWRGDIGIGMNETQWTAWFASYSQKILHYAKMAEKHNVAMLSVSCELITASLQEARWRKLIKEIRKVYHGTLTDSANWAAPGGSGEVTQKKWWDAVDVIGVDEYYVAFSHSFNKKNGTYPSMAELEAIWKPVEEQFLALHKKWNKTIIFSEMGYCSGVNGSCYDDGAKHIPSPKTTNESLTSQARQYHAALSAMEKYDWFEGVFWWNWASDAAFGGNQNACMDPKFKPAEDVLRYWYQATVPKPEKPDYPATCKCWL